MVHQCRKEQHARAARHKKLNYGTADAVGDSNLKSTDYTETEERFMNDGACLELLTQYKDRYKFSSHAFILADIPDSYHNDWEDYDNSH